MRLLPALFPALVVACAPADPDAPIGYSALGSIPEDADVDALLAELPPGAFAVVGAPSSPDAGLLLAEGSELERVASADFSAVGNPTCVDCGTNPCVAGATTRTLRFTLRHDRGWDAEEFVARQISATNFTNVSVSPASFSAPLGNTVTLDVTGTLPQCRSFSYSFDLLGEQRIFVTSTTANGNRGGVAGGDAICAARASAAGLTGSWVAWMADSSHSAASRTTQYDTAYVTTTGTTIAATFPDLTDGTVQARIDKSELGAAVAASYVWTGAGADGTGTGYTCNDWTTASNMVLGTSGRTDRTTSGWSAYMRRGCGNAARFFCVEQ